MTDKEKIGKAFRDMRTSRTDYTVEEASSRLNKSKVWLSQIETGKKNIYFEDAKKLCSIYGCSLSDVSDIMDKM
nr:MAG TPA: helix-turn-helix domain protein [Caudoviricetes sp.]